MTIEQLLFAFMFVWLAYISYVCFLLTKAVDRLIDDFHDRKSRQDPRQYNPDAQNKTRESIHNH